MQVSFSTSKLCLIIFANSKLMPGFLLFSVLLSLIIYFLPDSPIWLRSKNRHNEADYSEQWLKLHDKTTKIQVSETLNIAEKELQKELDRANENSIRVIFTRPIFLPLSIGLVLLVIQQVSGIDSIIFFTVEIFRASGNCGRIVKGDFARRIRIE